MYFATMYTNRRHCTAVIFFSWLVAFKPVILKQWATSGNKWCSCLQAGFCKMAVLSLGQQKHCHITASKSCHFPCFNSFIFGLPVEIKGKGSPYSITERRVLGLIRFLAVSLQVTWVINQAVDLYYFPPGLQLPPQSLRGLLPVSLLGEQRHDGCKQFA